MSSYEFFYPGTKSNLDPNSEFSTGYKMNFGGMGVSTDPRMGNQIQEISNKLNTGIKNIEIEGLQPDIFDSIPKQQLKEMNRLAKLTGSEATLHGPLIEASGYDRQGWSEAGRVAAETQIKSVMDRAHEISPDGNMPVTFHSTAMLPSGREMAMEKVEGERKAVPKEVYIVDPRSGQIVTALKPTERYFPGEPSLKEFDPEKEIVRMSKDQWSQELGNINFSALRGEETVRRLINDETPRLKKLGVLSEGKESDADTLLEGYAESRKNPEEYNRLSKEERKIAEDSYRELDHASIFLKDSYRGLKEMYNRAYKESGSDSPDRAKLDAYANSIKNRIKDIESSPEKLQEFAEVIQEGIKLLNGIETPKIFKPLNEFVIEKSATTFGNAAFYAWQKYGDKAPIVSIENPPAGSGLSTGQELKELAETARKKFVDKAVIEGVSKSEAEDAAKKLIGVTWDVGHINMLRKFGYDKDDILKETEAVKKLVKHVHLSDNFGMEHTELPMGMGNVPIKEIMEKLGKEGYDAKKIIEAGNWWQHIKTPPIVPTLEAFGSPVYPMAAQPGWNQAAGTYGNYFAFPSAYMPEQHFALYGAGFSGLPQELGGQIPGKGNRLTGTPME